MTVCRYNEGKDAKCSWNVNGRCIHPECIKSNAECPIKGGAESKNGNL
jgi:hypothetical protein